MTLVQALLNRLRRERRSAPDLVVLLRTFDEWSRVVGFPGGDAGLEALRENGAVASYRIQSAKIKLLFKVR